MTEICAYANFHTDHSRRNPSGGYRIHPVYILLKVRNRLILFLLALLPAVFGNNASHLSAALLLQLLTLAAVLVPAVISRQCMNWNYNGKAVSLSRGVFFKKETVLYSKNIYSASIIKTPFLSLFRSVRLEMCSGDSGKKAEITLFLSPDDANALVMSVMRPSKALDTLIPNTAPFLLTSASRANFAVGLTSLMTFLLSLGGKSHGIYSCFSKSIGNALPYLPDIFVSLTALFLIGWAVHFLKICFLDARQVTTVSDNNIITVKGLISTRLTCIRKDSISCCEVKSTFLTSIANQCMINLFFTEHRKSCGLQALTACPKRDSNIICQGLTFSAKKPDLSIGIGEHAGLIWWFPYACGALAALFLQIHLLITDIYYYSGYLFILSVFLVLLIWKCAVGISGSAKAHISLSGQYVSISSVHNFSFCSQRIFAGHIAEFRVTQTIFQRNRKLCTAFVRAEGSRHGLKCRNLPCSPVIMLMERIK